MRSRISSKLIFASCVGYFVRAYYGFYVTSSRMLVLIEGNKILQLWNSVSVQVYGCGYVCAVFVFNQIRSRVLRRDREWTSNVKESDEWNREQLTGYQKRDWPGIWNKTDRELNIKMRLVNEKQKRVSELKGISATSLREKDTDGHCKWMSKMLAWPRFRHVCYDVYVRNEWHW